MVPEDVLEKIEVRLKQMEHLMAQVTALKGEIFELRRSAYGIDLNETVIGLVKDKHVGERADNCMRNSNIELLGELVQRTREELSTVKNAGRKTIQAIIDALALRGLELRMSTFGWQPPEDRKRLKWTYVEYYGGKRGALR
jgi:DNA-directed RNA polymerase alpha subunit